MKKEKQSERFVPSLEENMKKALTEMLVLQLLSHREYYISELTRRLEECSGGALTIVFPYGAIYRLCEGGYIEESSKRSAPDRRLRRYYRITDAGREYLARLRETYDYFTQGIQAVLEEKTA